MARVWVNGREIGWHEGPFVPFELDVTDAIQAGRNSLVVGVRSESFSDVLASATQYAGHPLGGITRKVTLFAIPRVNVAGLSVATVFDSNFKNATLKLQLNIANESEAAAEGASIRLALRSPGGDVVPIPSALVELPHLESRQVIAREVSIPVESAKQWDTEHPNLYTLQVELRSGGNVETVTQRVGFRQVEVRGNQVFVNNHPIKMRGVCRHETHPLLGRSLTPELCRRDAEVFRAANVNYIRTSHYPPSEEFLAACDDLGLFVECEAPLCWVNHGANSNWQSLNYRDPQLFPFLLRANQANVVFNRNHPSILIWSLANESSWSPLFAAVNQRVKQLDPTRPTSFHDQCWGSYNNDASQADIAVYHYPGTNGPAKCDEDRRPTLFGEYCHVQTYNQREHFTDPGIRDEWGPRFAEMYDLMYRHPGCLGGAIWSGIDDAFHLPDGQVEGYGYWGVIDGWRRSKPETFHVRKAYSPIRVTTTRVPAGNSPICLALENRYDFASLNEVHIQWQVGRQKGTVTGQIPARGAGEIAISPARPVADGETLRVTFIDPRGFVCEAVELPVGEKTPALSVPKPLALGRLKLETNAASFLITGEHFSCEVLRQSGQLSHLRLDGKTILLGGPVLLCLPLESGPCEPRDLTQFGAFNDVCDHWAASSVTARAEPDAAILLEVKGACDAASGSYTLRFQTDGRMEVHYDLRASKEVNPRQVGMVFYAPRNFDTLRWERKAEWTGYPADHIGRPVGEAKAAPNADTHFVHLTAAPETAWSLDANLLGTADFRSTKGHLLAASLQDHSRHGLFVQSDGSQAARAFVDGERIGWLIAVIDAGGGEGFFGTHHAPDRHPLKPGSAVQDTIHLRLMKP